jgi:ArsR family transcriptional regulator
VSHHLRKLAEVGLLRRRQQGTWAFYALDREALARLEAVTSFSRPASDDREGGE